MAPRFFSPHEAAVITEAVARLVPGPEDDPAERDSPGAREADVPRYLDTLLSALESDPERIHMAGPWSDRHGGEADHMAQPVPLSQVQRSAWTQRLTEWRQTYREGVGLLDTLADGDFAGASRDVKDRVLASQDATRFVDVLFGHTIEGMYAAPEYGGNRDLAGWRDIGFPGDVQPIGYTAEQVADSDGPDPLELTGAVDDTVVWLRGSLQRLMEDIQSGNTQDQSGNTQELCQ